MLGDYINIWGRLAQGIAGRITASPLSVSFSFKSADEHRLLSRFKQSPYFQIKTSRAFRLPAVCQDVAGLMQPDRWGVSWWPTNWPEVKLPCAVAAGVLVLLTT